MDLKLLQDFVALAGAGSFSKAARRRHVTQPAFSKRIRMLEDWVGVPLVDRHSHPVALTEAGQLFLARAQKLIHAFQAARDDVVALASQVPEVVSFASATTLSQTFFPRWITPIRRQLPNLRFQLSRVGYFVEHIEQLHNREVDFFLSYATSGPHPGLDLSGLVWKTIGKSALYPVSARNSDGTPAITFAQGQTEPVPHVYRTETSFLGQVLRAAQIKWNLELDDIFEVGSTVILRSIVREGHGVGWLTPESVQRELKDGLLIRAAEGFEVPIEIRLYRLDARISDQAEEVWDNA